MKRVWFCGLIVFSLGCSSHSLPELYPVDRAHEDGGWTVLERNMPWGESVSFLLPDQWLPDNLKDHHLIKVDIFTTKQTSTLTFTLVEP